MNVETLTTTGLPLAPRADVRPEYDDPVFDGVRGQCLDAPSYLPTGGVFQSQRGNYALIQITLREGA